jgi:uncharacterized membrane protein
MGIKQFIEIGADLLLVYIAYYIGHWFGFALAVVYIASRYGYRMLDTLQTTRDVLLSRLPERCSDCDTTVTLRPKNP